MVSTRSGGHEKQQLYKQTDQPEQAQKPKRGKRPSKAKQDDVPVEEVQAEQSKGKRRGSLSQAGPGSRADMAKRQRATVQLSQRKAVKNEQNRALADVLREMAEDEKANDELWKWRAYLKAVHSIETHPKRIASAEEAKKLPGVGKSIAASIDEVLRTGHLKKLEELEKNEDLHVVRDLCRVDGLGPTRARKLVKKGVRTLEDLRKHTDALTVRQRIGLKHFDDLSRTIPRREAEQHLRYLQQVVQEIDKDVVVELVGQYRRKLPQLELMEVLLSSRNYSDEMRLKDRTPDLLEKLAKELERRGYLPDVLHRGKTLFGGVVSLGNAKDAPANASKTARKIELNFVPHDCMPTALLHFTGSNEYTHQLHIHAQQQGFKLSPWYLSRIDSSGNKTEQIDVKSEKDIFNEIGVQYVPPEARNW